MKNIFKDEKKYLVALALILVARIVLHILLYKSGFESLSADEFGRIVRAAHWTQNLHLIWYGPWLPFHTYLFGTALRIVWDLLYVPRMIAVLFGLVSIVLMYFYASRIFKNTKVGLVGALLLAVNPAHIWLSSVPLTEIIHTALILAVMLLFINYLRTGRLVTLFLSTLLLSIANGFRFEAWMFTVVYSLYLGFLAISKFFSKESSLNQVVLILGAAALPWIFPIVWIVSDFSHTGQILHFMSSVKTYKLKWYGDTRSYFSYWRTFISLDSFSTVAGVIGLVYSTYKYWCSKAVKYAALMAVIPFLLFVGTHAGQIEPLANYIRYLASFQFLLIPFAAFLLLDLTMKIIHTRKYQTYSIALLLIAYSITQIHAAFNFQYYPGKDPSSQGLLPGLQLKSMREANADLAQRPILLELSYWEYLAFHVGANDISTILYDREFGFLNRGSKSIISENFKALQYCILSHNIGLIVVKSPELKDTIRFELQVQPFEEFNGYAFFHILEGSKPGDELEQNTCPLNYNSGY
ncbi:hypothetical protein ACFLUA_01155 [Chloroflexota bacterium]